MNIFTEGGAMGEHVLPVCKPVASSACMVVCVMVFVFCICLSRGGANSCEGRMKCKVMQLRRRTMDW